MIQQKFKNDQEKYRYLIREARDDFKVFVEESEPIYTKLLKSKDKK